MLFLESEIVFQDVHLVELHISGNRNHSPGWTISTVFAAIRNHHFPCDFGDDLSRLHVMSFWTRHFFLFHPRDGDLKWISSLSMATAATFIDRFCLLRCGDCDGIKSPESKLETNGGMGGRSRTSWGVTFPAGCRKWSQPCSTGRDGCGTGIQGRLLPKRFF